MLLSQPAELSIVLTRDEISFIKELCGCELDIDIQLKFELTRMWKSQEGTLWLTGRQLESLVGVLLRQSEHAHEDIREWAQDIATWLVEQSHKIGDEVIH